MTPSPRVRSRWIAAGLLIALAAALGVAVWWSHRDRSDVVAPDWTAVVQVLAGDGVEGHSDGDAARARFSDPFGVAVGPDGTVYVTTGGDTPALRRILPGGVVDTLAGGRTGFRDGLGPAAAFNAPSGLAIDAAGTLYVADTGNHAVRRVAMDGRVETLAGDGTPGFRDGPAAQARFNGPVGIAVDRRGRVIVADTYNDRIRAITPGGQVVTLAGSGLAGLQDGAAEVARFDTPGGVAVGPDDRLLVADTGNDRLRVVGPAGDVSTLGSVAPFAGDTLDLRRPLGIAVDPRGDVAVTDARGRIRSVAGGAVRTLAGSTPGFADGAAADARFRAPAGLAADGMGRLVVADAGNALIRVVAAPSRAGWRPPASPRTAPRFDLDAFAWQPLLWPVEPMTGPHELAGTLGEARGDPGGSGRERFHAGIDVRVPHGTPVVAVRDGRVSGVVATGGTGSLNEWVAIGPISYVHLRVGRDRHDRPLGGSPFIVSAGGRDESVRVRVRRGTRIRAGETIGTVNRFNHVHLNVGWPGEEHNPLLLRIPRLADTVAPTIARGGVRLFDEGGLPLERRERGRLVVRGRVQIVVDAWDQVDGSAARRRLGVYRLGYQVLEPDGRPAPGFERPRVTLRFDRLGPDPTAPRLVFAPGSGIRFYGNRETRFLYRVTTRFERGLARPEPWDTAGLPPGEYTLRVIVADANGNEAAANRDLPLSVVP